MKDVRVCFLDVDGVLCCNHAREVERSKLLLLQKVIRRTNAKVVLSTNWRLFPELKTKIILILASFGIDVIGATPLLGPDEKRLRPQEIGAWLDMWNSAPGRPKVKHFVAVDDRLLTSERHGALLKGAAFWLSVLPLRHPLPRTAVSLE